MRAVVCTKYGPPDVLKIREVKKPIPKDHEVLVKVHAAAITTAGLIGRKGTPLFTRLFNGLAKPKNNILGMELAGEVVALGKRVSLFEKGDQVFGLTGTSLGSNAEYVCLSEEAALVRKPHNLNYSEAAAIVEGGLTALNFLKNKGNIRPGQKVLIYGASGSVGTASIQLARHYGAEVTGVCSGPNSEMVRSLGADRLIDYTKEDFAKNGRNYDLIFDTVGKRSYGNCKDVLTQKGTYLNAAGLSTLLYMFLTSLFGHKKAIFSATYMRATLAIKKDLVVLKKLVEVGALKPVIDRNYTMEQTAEAHRYVETGRKKGNVVIAMT